MDRIVGAKTNPLCSHPYGSPRFLKISGIPGADRWRSICSGAGSYWHTHDDNRSRIPKSKKKGIPRQGIAYRGSLKEGIHRGKS